MNHFPPTYTSICQYDEFHKCDEIKGECIHQYDEFEIFKKNGGKYIHQYDELHKCEEISHQYDEICT